MNRSTAATPVTQQTERGGVFSLEPAPKGRLHNLDLARGLACLSMPIYHTVYNLFVVGLVDHQWAKHAFWEIWQTLGLGTFVLVSGMAFTVSTRNGVRWMRLLRRGAKLAVVAAGISILTYMLMPERFVRFGVIHFFATTILLAPLFKPLGRWMLLPGLVVVSLAFIYPRAGVSPEPWLYVTGFMSERPRAMDYIPLMPWFGVFLVGMGIATLFKVPETDRGVATWKRPIIWLGKHSLSFYLIHQVVVYAALLLLARLLG